jgi:hypothetical protein
MNLRVQLVLVQKVSSFLFILLSLKKKAPFELIYSDLWRPSPVSSRIGNKYYISFLDAYSRYTWLFSISHKNDAFSIFLQFQQYVERYFNLKIKSVQSDWGGKFHSISNFLTNVVLLIESLVPTLINKTVPLNVNTVTLLKLVLPFSIMPVYPFIFGMMPFKPLVISSTVSPPLFFTISLMLPNYLKLHLIILFSKFLAVHVGLIFVPITQINSNLVLFNVFFLVIVFATEVTNAIMCPLIVSIYPVTDQMLLTLQFLDHILDYSCPCILRPASTTAFLQPGLIAHQAQLLLQAQSKT